jgi:hypothetical protein
LSACHNKQTMSVDKIYVQLLDGSTTWVPVEAKKIASRQYEILEGKEYINFIDPLYLLEFYPGDIVELGLHTFFDKTTGQVAKKLIKEGQWHDRKYSVFKFKATIGQLIIDKKTAGFYQNEIERVKKENLTGQFFYPSLIETVEKLDNLFKHK